LKRPLKRCWCRQVCITGDFGRTYEGTEAFCGGPPLVRYLDRKHYPMFGVLVRCVINEPRTNDRRPIKHR
jgi:hypothetical protein